MTLRWTIVCACCLAALVGLPSIAQDTAYSVPPKPLADLVDAPRLPRLSLAPDRKNVLLLHRRGLPSLEEVALPELRLGGLRFNPETRGPSRRSGYLSASLVDLGDGRDRAVTGLPDRPILSAEWAPTSAHVALVLAMPDQVALWLVDVASAKARKACDVPLNAVLSSDAVYWAPDGASLLTLTVPTGTGDAPRAPALPAGPNVQVSSGETAAVRTYQDLLASPYDEALFAHYLTSSVTRVGIDGSVTPLGKPDLFTQIDGSPDGRYVLVARLHKPFSYLVPYYRFPRATEVWDADGKPVAQIADLPGSENIPKGFDAVPTGRREVAWRDDAPATLVWAEAADGGDPAMDAPVRDKVYLQAAPFTETPRLMADLGTRLDRITWGEGFGLVYEAWWRTRRQKVWTCRDGQAPKLLFDRSLEDRYGNPGMPLRTRNAWGRPVLVQTGAGDLLFAGEGASEKGNIPFLDSRGPEGGEARRLWTSVAPYYAEVLATLDAEGTRLLISREAKNEPPNYYVAAGDTLTALTHETHPTPQLADVSKELITYQRADGVQLSGTLYLPPGYKPEDGPLPTLLWAYPVEFKSADAAGQISDSPYRFAEVSYWGPLPYLAVGYAVLDDPSMPIIGEGDTEPNDSFRRQLVSSAAAAIEELTRRGVTDPDRVAVGGHSYGAFMVANLLAHSDLFRAGIARSGAYNRTLTPFGFQSEERTFWEAPEIYGAMSPFFHAEKIDEPLLLIHGEADNNPGTFPLQSQRLFHAVKGLGGTARLVMLPFESHGYRARESMLHVLYEQYQWLETHVKNAPPRRPKDAG